LRRRREKKLESFQAKGSLKALLGAAPLKGVDVDRQRDLGRVIEL